MTRTRPALAGLVLLLLGLLGVSVYLYHNTPGLLREQLQHFLQRYGVQDIQYDPVAFSSNTVLVDNLRLSGVYGGFAYKARVDSTDLRYNWRTLLAGNIQSLTLAGLQMSIEQTAGSEPQLAPVNINLNQILPHHFIERLPLQSLKVPDWHLEYRSADLLQLGASGSLLIDRHLDLQLASALAGSEISAALRVATNPRSLDLALALRESDADIALVKAQLQPTRSDVWEWNAEGQIQYAPLLRWLRHTDAEARLKIRLPDALSLQGQSTFTASAHHPAELNLRAAPGKPTPLPEQLLAQIHTVNEIRQLDYEGSIDGVTGTVAIDAQLEAGNSTLTVQPTELKGELTTQRLSLPQATQRWLGWGETIPIHWHSGAPVQVASDQGGDGSLQLRDTRLTLGDEDSRLELSGLSVAATFAAGEPKQLHTQLNASIGTRLRKQTLPQLAIALRQQGSVEHSELDLRLADTTQSLNAQLQGTLNLATGAGEHQLNAQIKDLPQFAAQSMPLLQHFELVQQGVEILSGSIALDSALQGTNFALASWSQQSRLGMTDVSGSVGDYRFDGLALAADWTGITQWQTRQPIEISLANLNLGFLVNDVKAQLSLPKPTPIASPTLRVERFSAKLFGGRLFLPQPQSWDFAAPSNQLTLQAQQWQLSDLVALLKNADIQAQGTLEGELPMTVAGGRIIIDDGYLRALPPGGSIRYTPNDATRALAGGSPELGLALDLLSDFQYQVLSSQVQLDAAGNLLLGLSLSGSNPSRYEGQPINFNINLEQNLDPLLQSLRLSAKLVEQIEGGLQ